MSSQIANLIDSLTKAQGHTPTASEMKQILRLIGGLNKDTPKKVESDSEEEEECEWESDSEEEESDSEEDSESDSDEEESESDSDIEEVACKPKRKQTTRGKGFKLFKKNGGTVKEWSKKSEKYKNSYYNKHK